MTPEQLKASILQYAIQGKLVEQRSEEGTAEELYQHIQADKLKLLNGKKEGKLASEDFKDEDIPYDIPESWKWVRFGHIMINRDAERIPLSVSEREKLEKKYDYYGASGVIDKVDRFLFSGKLLLIGEDGANLLSRSTPIAFIADGEYWVNNHAHVLDCNKKLVCIEYIMYYINAITLAPYVTGTAQPKMNQEKMNSIPVALPPFKEQCRIVAKIEEFLPYVNRYAEAYEKLEQFNAKFPEDMKKSILQYAIQGKLVEQRAEEGTAEELYRQIQEEKQTLINEGKIKKEKPLAEITEEEIPFDIPDSWIFCRLGECIDLLSGQDLPANRYNDKKEGIVYLTGASNIDNNSQIIINRWTTTPTSVAKQGNLLLTCKGTIGKMCILNIPEAHIARQIMAITEIMVSIEYLRYFIEISISNLQSKAKSMIPGIDRDTVRGLLLPLPPLEEQHRIVAKIEELLPYCDRLKE